MGEHGAPSASEPPIGGESAGISSLPKMTKALRKQHLLVGSAITQEQSADGWLERRRRRRRRPAKKSTLAWLSPWPIGVYVLAAG